MVKIKKKLSPPPINRDIVKDSKATLVFTQYLLDLQKNSEALSNAGFITDAPDDGGSYERMYNKWVETLDSRTEVFFAEEGQVVFTSSRDISNSKVYLNETLLSPNIDYTTSENILTILHTLELNNIIKIIV